MIAIVLVLGLIVFSVPTAMALKITFANGYGPYDNASTTGGGEFTVNLEDGLEVYYDNYDPLARDADMLLDYDVQTFCVETSEHISAGETYDVTISDTSQLTGVELNLGTAWLYHEFQSGTLTGYDYTDTTSRINDALLLQNAIWYFMGSSHGSTNEFTALAISELSSLSLTATNPNNGKYGVGIMNLTASNGVASQDQLLCIPDASIMFLLGPALLALGMIGRRKSKRA